MASRHRNCAAAPRSRPSAARHRSPQVEADLRPLTIADECFWNLQGDRSKITALATSDETVGDKVSAEPIIWTHEHGKGRVVASTLGHFDWTFDDPFFRTILLRGIAWAAGESPYRFDPLILRGIPLKD